uniref:fructokinase n=1 Tax=Caenorhabditis japonica TaxID=281687 RepID=A0A8R1EGQ4_CAEJA
MYANQTPTEAYRGAMTIARELTLEKRDGEVLLVQRPARELEHARTPVLSLQNASIRQVSEQLNTLRLVNYEIYAEWASDQSVQFALRSGADNETLIGVDASQNEVYVDRSRSGISDFHEHFLGRHAAGLKAVDSNQHMRIYVDYSSVEVFANDGQAVITDMIYPDAGSMGISVQSQNKDLVFASLHIYELSPIRVEGAIEAGGTKFVCGVGNERGEIEDWCSFPTEHPETTLAKVIDYFRDKGVAAIGIGSFGPIDLQPGSPTYGYITTTPKPGWGNCNVIGLLKREFPVPFGWDTDVNAAALGEVTWGAAKGLDHCVYYTIGTGVGIGLVAGGKRVHGLLHPEGGHIRTRRHPEDHFAGLCPYHGDCLEGMAAGPAIQARWQSPGSELPTDHPAWE